MSKWNHRVIAIREERQDFFMIHEVHYDDDGNICSWTENPVSVSGDSLDEMRTTLHYMLRCLSKPILIEQRGKLMPWTERPPAGRKTPKRCRVGKSGG